MANLQGCEYLESVIDDPANACDGNALYYLTGIKIAHTLEPLCLDAVNRLEECADTSSLDCRLLEICLSTDCVVPPVSPGDVCSPREDVRHVLEEECRDVVEDCVEKRSDDCQAELCLSTSCPTCEWIPRYCLEDVSIRIGPQPAS